MAANKRVTPSRPKTSRDLLAHDDPPAARKQRLVGKSRDTHDEIHRLECFISAAPRISRQQRLARINIVPPLERDGPALRRPPGGRLPLQQQIALKRQRFMLVAELAVVGLGIVGAVGWLNHFLHFLH